MTSRHPKQSDKPTTTVPPLVSTPQPAQLQVPLQPAALVQRAAQSPAALTPAEVLQLHRTIGNRAVGQLVQGHLSRHSSGPAAAPGGTTVQPKLLLGPVGDRYEQEADRVAQQVVQRLDAAAQPPDDHAARRQEAEDESLTQMQPAAAIQRMPDVHGGTIPPHLEAAIHQARGHGHPLPEMLRGPMEQAFAADFRGVQVHASPESDALNGVLGARAFTTGQDIFFKHGEYDPASQGGRALLAHELTHVVQQRGNRLEGKQKVHAGTIQRKGGKADPGTDLPKLKDLAIERFKQLLASEDKTVTPDRVTQEVEARAVRDAQRNVQDPRFMQKIFDMVRKQTEWNPNEQPRDRDLNEVQAVIAVALDGAPNLSEAQTTTRNILEDYNKRGRDLLETVFFRSTAKNSRRLAQAALGLRSERKYKPEEENFAKLATTFLEARANIGLANMALTKSQKTKFAAALKKMPTIQYLLETHKSEETPVSNAQWNNGGSLSDDITESTKNRLEPPTDGTANPRKDIDNGKFQQRVNDADQYIRTFVEPHLLATLPRPKIVVHLKYSLSPYNYMRHQKENLFRAFQRDNEIHLAQDEDTPAIVHEVGHYLEDNLPSEFWHDLQIMLRARHITSVRKSITWFRKSGKPVRKAGHGERFMREEGRYRGEYPATGKYTSSAYGDVGGTEATSMTLEFLSDPYRVKTMIEEDPQQTAIVLRGLRPKEYAQTPELRDFDHFLPARLPEFEDQSTLNLYPEEVLETSESPNLVKILNKYIGKTLTLTQDLKARLVLDVDNLIRDQAVVIKAGTAIKLLDVDEKHAEFDVARAGYHEIYYLPYLYAALGLGA